MRFPSLRLLALSAFAGVMLLLACQQSEKTEESISFNTLYDSLIGYDSVLITLKDKDGHTIDVAFEGKVRRPGDLEKLPTPHWDGGKITVVITGYDDDVVVYNSETPFDGATNKRESTHTFIVPGISLTYGQSELKMLAGDSLGLPFISIEPVTLTERGLLWTSSAPDVIAVGLTGFKALKVGISQIMVKLAADPSKSLVLKVTVLDRTSLPESITLSDDFLRLSAGGAAGHLDAVVTPSTASKDVIWSVDDKSVATVDADGSVKGLKAGSTFLRVRSALKDSVSDFATLEVSDPVPPVRVVFAKETTELFVGGSEESLLVAIEPPQASQEVEFSISEGGKLAVNKAKVSGLAEGTGYVVARSKEKPELMDTLKIKITVKQVIDSVALSKKTFTLYTGGADELLTASITPSTSVQTVQWRSGNGAIAKVLNGKVTGVAPGHTYIYATSAADSTKKDSADVTVKTDAPVVDVGRADTTVSVGVSVTVLPVVAKQEYGSVAKYRWDIDGAPGWDDSADAVSAKTVKCDKEQDYLLRFYARDTEGNETIVSKKVSAVVGPVVLIVSPENGAYFTKSALKIVWSIDGKEQTTGTDTVLKDGANTITRSAKDAAGKIFPASVTVYLDSVAPAKPIVKGPGGSASNIPMWTWNPGGGGAGFYRISLDSANFSSAAEIKDTLFIPAKSLSEGSHTLYVQERDAAGNWSAVASKAITVDFTGPGKPDVKVNAVSPSNNKRPKWTWTSASGGSGLFQYKFDNNNFSSGASTPGVVAEFTPPADLGDGLHTLYVRESDSLGNWSDLGSMALTTDTTAPDAPKVLGASPTSAMPKWTWSSGGGGSGDYRFKVGANPINTDPETKLLEYALVSAVSKTTYILYIQERDAAGNWSPPANLAIFYDLSKPTVTFKNPQPSGTYRTKSATVDVDGLSSSPQGAGSVKSITYTVDGVAGSLGTNLLGDGSWSIKGLGLTNNKTIALKVIATDVANNVGEATLNILMDNTTPGAPSFTTQPPAIVNKADTLTKLTWTWNQPAGTDSFVVKLNGTELGAQTGTTYAVNTISDGNYKLEVSGKDLTGNASAFTASATVLVDQVSPNAPTLSQPATPRRTAQWTWAAGGGGNGTFQCQLDGTTVSLCTSPYSLPNPTDGDHTFRVRESDVAGNQSTYTSTTVTIDLKDPTISRSNYLTVPTQIANTFSAFTGTAADNVGIKQVTYKIGGAATQSASGTSDWNFPAALDTGTQTVTVTVEDLAGNTASASVQITNQPNVIFVRKGATGKGDGTSWANAFPELGPLLTGDKTYSAGKKFWISAGSYAGFDGGDFILRPNTDVYGGFAVDGAGRTLDDRDFITHQSVLTSAVSNQGFGTIPYSDHIKISGFRLSSSYSPIAIWYATSATVEYLKVSDLSISTPVLFIKESNVDINHVEIVSNQTLNSTAIEIRSDAGGQAAKVRIRNSFVNYNQVSSFGGIGLFGGSLCLGTGASFSGNDPAEVGVISGSLTKEKTGVYIGPYGISGPVSDVDACFVPF